MEKTDTHGPACRNVPACTAQVRRFVAVCTWVVSALLCIGGVLGQAHADATYTVGDGQDHSTIQAAIDTIPDDLSGQGVQTVEIHETGGSAPYTYNENVVVDGFSGASLDNYIKITVGSSARHDGTAGTGVRIDQGSMEIRTAYTVVEWLEVSNTDGGDQNSHITITADGIEVRNLLVHGGGSGSFGAIAVRPDTNNNTFTIQNCIVYDVGNDQGIAAKGTGTGNVTNVYNCTVYNALWHGIEVGADGHTVNIRNCIANADDTYGKSINKFSGTLDADYNMLSDDPKGDQGDNTIYNKNIAAQLQDPSAGDFHLVDTSSAINAGTDLSGQGVDIDIDGDARPYDGGWDIGADEWYPGNYPPVFSFNSVSQGTSRDGIVTVTYDLSDEEGDAASLLIAYSYDGNTWYQAHIENASVGSVDNTGVGQGNSAGQITGISTDQSGVTFTWDTQDPYNENGPFTGFDDEVYLRVTPDDGNGSAGVAKESAAFWVNNTPYFVWDNGGADAQASTGDNWDYHAVPGKSDTVRFGPVSADVTWDLGLDTVTVFSIEDGFSNRVTFDNASVPDTVYMDSISVASGALLDLDGTVILAEVFNEAGTAQYTGEYTPSNSSVLTGSGAILTNVTGPPSPITLNQNSFSVQEGETVQIVVNAYGATPFDYRWTRVSTGGEVARTDNTNSNHDTLVIQNVTKADHDGRQYRCEVTNALGSATSETVTLNVYLELNAAFDVTREFHQDGMDATFTDQSTGDIGKWRWVFGDGQDRPYNDYQAQVVHTYSDTGTYQCTLYVEGSQPAMGSDFAAMQIEYYPPDTSNPLVIRDEDVGRLDGRTVAFTVRNLDSIEVMFAEDVDVGIWLARQSLGENKTVIDSVFKRYRDLDSLKNAGPSTNTFSDTIRIEDPLARRYEIWASPIVDGTPRAFVLGKQEDFYFEIRDTLSLSGNYLGNTGTLDDVQLDVQHLEDAQVRLVHSAELDTPLVDSVILEYGFEMDNYLVSDRVAASQVVQDDPFIWSITDEEFMSRDTTRVYVRVRQKGRNDITPKSDTVSFLTGWPVPENPSLLSIQHKTAYSIRIGWDATDADAPDSLRIWRIQDSAEILVNRPNNWGGFNAVTTDKMQDERVFDNLRQNTWYSFAMQVYADRQWSYVGPNAYKIVRTDTSGVRLPPQVLARMGIDSLHYDPSNRQLRCYWRADTIVSDMRVAITWSTDPAAYTRDTIFATDPRDVTSPTGVIIDTFDVDSIFNDSLYVFLWGGKQGSYDHDAVRKKMVDAVWIPQPSWQRVVYFPQGVDTIRAFGGEFFIAGPYSLPDTTHDRVYREQLSSAHQGFIDLGGYSLQKNAREPLWIGVRYDRDSIPADTMVSTLGMYRVRDGAVERVYTSMNHDSARHIMWFRTHEFSDATTGDSIPFFVLADTAAPRITFVGDTADTTAIGRSDSVAYRFTVDDNIANVRWQMRVSYIRTNGEVEDTLLHGFTAGSGDDTGKVVVDNDLFAVNFGALLHFELWDGVHPLSYDLSRRIEKQVVVISDEEKWIPLFVTSHLDSMEPSQVLMPLSSQQATFTYDNTQFRLFKWFPDKGDDGDWVEYSDWQGYENTQKEQLKGDYALRPGTVQWLKTKKTKQFPCGIGMTPSLRDTHIISLHPGAWTDCANPFGFHIDMNDIAAATDTSKFEQLEVFLWRQRGGNDGRYTTPVMMYTPNWAEKNEYDHLLFTDSAYTIYNPTDTEIQLKIPPVPKAHTAFPNRGVDKRSGAGNGWHVEVITCDAEGTYIGSNYCGYDPSRSTTRYSAAMPPSWGRLHSGVMRHTDNAMSLYCVHGDTKEQGYRYRLKFTNTSDTARQVRVALRTAGAIPEDARIALVRSGTQGHTIEPVAAEDETQSFTIPAHGACTRVLLVGSDAYISRIASFKAALVRCTPSPFSRMVRVHYSVPAGVRDVAVQIYDYMGRRVWARRIHEPAAGVHALTWRPDAAGAMTAAGVYVVEMTVHDDNAAVIGQFRKKINYIP